MANTWKRIKLAAAEKGVDGNPLQIVIWLLGHYYRCYFLCELARSVPNAFVPMVHRWRGCKIGANVFIDRSVYLDNMYPELITIEDGVRLTAHAVVVCHFSPSATFKESVLPFSKKPVLLKKNAFVGVNATILPGVTVGEYALVGAGAVVTKHVPNKTLVAGNPAKAIRNL